MGFRLSWLIPGVYCVLGDGASSLFSGSLHTAVRISTRAS